MLRALSFDISQVKVGNPALGEECVAKGARVGHHLLALAGAGVEPDF